MRARTPAAQEVNVMSHPSTTQDRAPDLASAREHFPSLALQWEGQPVVFLDNPGGTQVPRECIEAMVAYLSGSNANTHGAFLTSQRTDALLDRAHAGMAAMLNAADAREVYFGPNMTTLTFALSRAIGRTLDPGDEIVVTLLDHDANVAPWLALQEERGVVVRMADVHLDTCTLDMDDLRAKINERTRLVAVGYASNAVGTINDVATIVGLAHEAGALAFVDAVQMAPHAPIDVQALGCDFLACSPYKFFGPHLGVMYGRLNLLQSLPAYKVRPAGDEPPDKWETGTQTHEAIAGLVGTLAYLATLGREHLSLLAPAFPLLNGESLELHVAFAAIQAYERQLILRLLDGLATVPGAHVYGLTSPADLVRRVPTVAVTISGHTPRALGDQLARRGIFAWDGNYYAVSLMERLGLEATGGALRLGLAHYNTPAEVDRTLQALHEIVDA
jgi:cysteine desulfurase family protein (TIGR01976 family)